MTHSASYRYPRFPYRRSPDQETLAKGGSPAHHRVLVVGAGLVGLTLALDLARRGVEVLVLDEDETVSQGSRSICFAKRSLEILDRLGLGESFRAKGITWNRGKVYFGERLVHDFDLLPEPGHAWPAFVNIQQYYAEEWLVAAAEASGRVELRWKNRVADVRQEDGRVRLEIETPDGPYRLTADWLLACDGARSTVRRALGLAFEGKVFQDRFLIADVKMQADFPSERRFWFDPPFNRGQSALLHRQADNVWRIDLQLGREADPELEKASERVMARLKAMLGEVPFTLEWVSVYSFQCRRLERFRHGRVFFLGDAAHQVSPFGARGGNGGIQDADNLAWKLAFLLEGLAPESLLDSYEAERIPAAEENIRHSTRATDFITPKDEASRALRDAVLELAAEVPFARRLINSGRLSRPLTLDFSPLVTPDREDFAGSLRPGAPAADAPLLEEGRAGWLLPALGQGFTLLLFEEAGTPLAQDLATLDEARPAIKLLRVLAESPGGARQGAILDREGLIAARYDGAPGTAILFRPDQHIAARWRRFEPAAVLAAQKRALAR